MAESDAPKISDSTEPAGESRNLPVPVPPKGEPVDANERWFARILRAVFGWKTGSIRSDLEVVLEASTPAESGFSPEESTMLRNILALRERRIADVMVPRADIVAVQQDIALGELIKVFETAAHSRLVVYNDTLDDPTGMVHIRDLVAFMTARATVDAEKNTRRKRPLPAGLDLRALDLSLALSAARILRQTLFVPPSMPAIDLLAKMQATRVHLALVIDEYGGTDGLVSIEDLVELIVGDIEDEHDERGEHPVVRQADGSYLAHARASLEEVVALVGADFDVGEATEEVDTLGGYLATRIGRVPVRGELVPGPGPYEIEVLDADPRRVKRVRIYRSRQPAAHNGVRPARAAAPALAPGAASPQPAAAPSPQPAAAEPKPPREP
ncbi:MAG TPA: hemolysin family protein [Xanthobacteraceae bacterium]|nr:hemolysin family protein [Xanthobacteraceae bacterium]